MRDPGLLALSFGLALALHGCGDSPKRNADMAVDLAVPGPDLAKLFDLSAADFAGVSCGNMSCGGGEVCCVTPVGSVFNTACVAQGSCGSGSAQALCDGPEDCPTTAQNCCAQVVFSGGGDGGNPMPTGGGATCTASCPALVTNQGTSTVFDSKLCHTPTDCAEYVGEIFGGSVKFDGCCFRKEISLRFCAPDDVSYAKAGGYTCL